MVTKKINNDNTFKRFKIMTIVILVLFCASYLTTSDLNLFSKINFFICFGILVWLFGDYELLQINRLYIYSLILTLLILGYGFLLIKYCDVYEKNPVIGMTKAPIALLIIQKPLRLVFKLIMKREPVIQRQALSIADFLYSTTLMVTPIMFAVF